MKKLIVFISAMLLIASSLMAEANLGFGGGVEFEVNLAESQQSKDGNVNYLFAGGDGYDEGAYNIKLSYAGMFNDNKTFFLMALDTDGEDFYTDGMNNDDGFFTLINHKPNDFVEIQVTGAFRFSKDDASGDNNNILDEWSDADGTYLKLKPNSMFNITFFPCNASTTIGSEFTSTSTQGATWNQSFKNSNIAGIGFDIFPMEGLSINAVINSKKLVKDTSVANKVEQYNAIGYKVSVKYANENVMNLNAAVEVNGNTQESSDNSSDITTKGINSDAATQMAINARASFVPVENLTLSTEFAMTTLNGAALKNDGVGFSYGSTISSETNLEKYDGETGTAIMVKALYDLSSLISMANQKTNVYAKYRMYGDNFIWDDGINTYTKSFVYKDGAFNRIDAGLNFNWNGVNVNPEFSYRMADKKIFTDDKAEATDTRTTATITVGYSF